MAHPWRRVALFVLAAFVSVTAISGAIFVVPTMPREWILFGPFTDWTIPAYVLGIVVGGSATLAAIAVLLRPWAGAVLSLLAGVTIFVFELVETAVVGISILVMGPEFFQSWLQIIYLAIGAAQIAIAYRLWQATRTQAPRVIGFAH